ncbi:hypothetical protein D3C83_153950 [compost metagenome]
MSRTQCRHEKRQRLGESDESECEWIAGEVVHLPPDDGALNLNAQREREQSNDVAAEIRKAKCGERIE